MSETSGIAVMAKTDPSLRFMTIQRNQLNKEIRKRYYLLKSSKYNLRQKLGSYISFTFKIPEIALISKSKSGKYIFAKHAYRYFLERISKEGYFTSEQRERTFFSKGVYDVNNRKFLYTLEDIGKIANCNHATVLHSIKVINNMCDTDKQFKDKIELIKNKIENNKIKFPEI